MTFVKYPRMTVIDSETIPNIEVSIFEKICGSNTQFRKIDGKLQPGNKSGFLRSKNLSKFWFSDFFRWVYGNRSLDEIPEQYIFFGEWLSFDKIDYGKDAMNRFYLIDVFDFNKTRLIHYQEGVNLCKELGLEDILYLDILHKGKVGKKEISIFLKGSNYYLGNKEGLVLKDYQNQKLYKIFNPGFS